jgi:adenylate cyclase
MAAPQETGAMDPDRAAYHFDRFTLDLGRGILLGDGGAEVPLRPKSFALLHLLVGNAGQLLSRDAILEALWPGLCVTDESITQCVHDVRRALGDEAQRLLRTMPKRGYIFDVEVERAGSLSPKTPPAADPVDNRGQEQSAAGSAAPPAAERQRDAPVPGPGDRATDVSANPKRLRKQIRVAAALAAILIATGVAVWWWVTMALAPPLATFDIQKPQAPQSAIARASIAVLPFASLHSEAAGDYFADGLTEDIIAALGRFRELSVMSRATVFAYKGKSPTPAEIGRALGVRYVVEGSVRRAPDRIRVAASLTDTSGGAVLWSEKYDAELKDVFSVQDQITRRISGALAIRVTSLELALSTIRPPENLEAYDLVLQGRAAVARFTRIGIAQALEFFERAIKADPNYAAAYVGSGNTEVTAALRGWRLNPVEALERAEALAKKAIALDPLSPGGHALLGRITLYFKEYDRALDELTRAIDLNGSDAESYGALVSVLVCRGDIDGAIVAGEMLAQFQLEFPQTPALHLGIAYILADRSHDAIRVLERVVDQTPSYQQAKIALAAAYAQSGRKSDSERMRAEISKWSPTFVLEEFGSLLRDPAQREKLVGILIRAGL